MVRFQITKTLEIFFADVAMLTANPHNELWLERRVDELPQFPSKLKHGAIIIWDFFNLFVFIKIRHLTIFLG